MNKYAMIFLGNRPDLIPVVEFIRANPGCTIAEVRTALGREVARRDIRRLCDNGLIHRTERGGGKACRWSA